MRVSPGRACPGSTSGTDVAPLAEPPASPESASGTGSDTGTSSALSSRSGLGRQVSGSAGSGSKALGRVSEATRSVTGEVSAIRCGLKPSPKSSTPTRISRNDAAPVASSGGATGLSPSTVGASPGLAMHADSKAAAAQAATRAVRRRRLVARGRANMVESLLHAPGRITPHRGHAREDRANPRHRAGRNLLVLVQRLLAGAGAAALGGVEDELAHADAVRCDLDALVGATELHRLVEGQGAGLVQRHRGVGGSRTHVGELLLLGDVDVHVLV